MNDSGQPTQNISNHRRPSSLVTPVPTVQSRNKKNKKNDDQMKFVLDSGDELSSADQEYNISGHINDIRELVDQWRRLPNDRDWQVTVETAHLLKYWRSHKFETIRPFFAKLKRSRRQFG